MMHFGRFAFPSRRSNMVARSGMVATSQPLAAQAGLDVLKAGGNAIDAAIATVATLCVVEPCSTGIGGDAFALIWSVKEGRLVGLNASGPAPKALTAGWLRDQGHQTMPARGPLTVTVPGALRGWQMALERFGTMSLDTLLARPISYARDGFAVSERIAWAWDSAGDYLASHPDSSRVWLPDGQAPRAGEVFHNPEFAATLADLATKGVDTFYRGDIGRQIVDCVNAAGGVLSMDDLGGYAAEWVAPIAVNYDNGYTFHELPPNGQGLAALLALNIIRGFKVPELGYGTVDYWHLLIEAMKLAYVDAMAYIGDPRLVKVPVDGLLSHTYTRDRRSLIEAGKALLPEAGQPPGEADTVYLAVADADGNMVSWIQSLYMGFGSGLTAGTTGVQLQNRGANFVLEADHPNEVGPGKRPFHTIIPGFITSGGQPWATFGVMGGFMQPQGHLQVGLNLVEFEMDPQSALDAPRFNWLGGRRVALEPAVDDRIYASLARRGHDLVGRREAIGLGFGGGQVIVRDPDSGVLIGGSDPRKDGAAAGW